MTAKKKVPSTKDKKTNVQENKALPTTEQGYLARIHESMPKQKGAKK